MDLTPARVARLQELFEAALSLPPLERHGLLATHEEDAALRSEVLALVAAHESGSTLPRATLGAVPSILDLASGAQWLGRRVGPWRVERLLGMGGMGTVCEAVRADDQFEKRVAIKFLHGHAANPVAVHRFRAERQILANLDHPNVATLLDGGVTDDGQPYLVMEYVDGQPITGWADAHGLARRARVELFLQVCGAVEAAHRNLIVHRDLKPGNILVTSAGRVKLLDFGIARLLGEVAADPATAPVREQLSFTPSYAAPEQILARPVTTAADVFSLGVVLYRLLSGRLPFETRTEPEAVAAPAGLDPELDTIIARALHVEREGRYPTVGELRADLERWLRDEPVLAFAGGRSYRLAKFARRHRTGTLLAALAMVAILGATAVASWQWHVARSAAADQALMNAFLMDVLEMSDPFSEGEDLTLAVALDRAAETIGYRFAGRPDLSAEIRLRIGFSMASRYRLEQADRQLGLALNESVEQFGPDDLRVLRVREAIAGLRLEQSRFEDAEKGYLGVVAGLEAQRRTNEPLYATALGNLGNVYLQMERYREADTALQRALRAESSLASPVAPYDHAGFLSNLAHAAHGLEDHPRAERYYDEAAAAYRKLFPDGSPDLAVLYNNLALLHEDRGDPKRALEAYQRSLAMRRKVFRSEHPMVVTALSNVARLLLVTGDAAGALRHAAEGASMADRVYTEPNRFHPSIHATLAAAQLGTRDFEAAHASWGRAADLLAKWRDAPPTIVAWVEEVRGRLCAHDAARCPPAATAGR